MLIGTMLGPYEIQAKLGEGGMGEVYKARDTRLDRTVAIKILPAELSADPDRRVRFEREARAVAALAHPHICTLFDIGESRPSGLGELAPSAQPLAPVHYLVMEHLPGQTLADRLLKGPLPLVQVLDIAAQIAEALDAAHKHGIIHRDLKPGNVMLTTGAAGRSGVTTAKLLDFGLAKLARHGERPALVSETHAVTEAAPLTARGTILGTLQYMAPEQLEGKEADARTDLWALGAILYEMVTGRRAFEGDSQVSLIGNIMNAAPADLATLQPLTPPALERVVKKCLAKHPDDRWDGAHDVADELRWIARVPSAGERPPLPRPRAMTLAAAAAVALGLVTLGAGLMWLLRPQAASVPPLHLSLDVHPADELNGGGVADSPTALTPGGSLTSLTWTPDGQALVFVGRRGGVQQLYVRRLDAAEARPLAGTEGAQVPTVSSDGQWVAFWAGGAIRKVPFAGGPVMALASGVGGPPNGLVWDASGRSYFGGFDDPRIWQIPPDGVPVALTELGEAERAHVLPRPLPGGKAVLYTVRKRQWSWGDEEIVAHTLATGARKVLLTDAADARYLPSGHLVFLRRGTLFAVPFAVEALEVGGPAVAVLDAVAQAMVSGHGANVTGAGQFDVSPTGTLAWIRAPITPHQECELVAVDRRGQPARLPGPVRAYTPSVRLSPDGRLLAVTVYALSDVGLWLHDLDRGSSRLLAGGGEAQFPVWFPDGRRLALNWLKDGRQSLAMQSADATAPPQVLLEDSPHPSSWTPDGRRLAAERRGDIVIVSLDDGKASARPLFETAHGELWPEFSPDGRWLAYGSDVSGRDEVYVRPYPGPGVPEQVSIDGGGHPAWNPSGKELFFVSPANAAGRRSMMAADIATAPFLGVGRPKALFDFDPTTLGLACVPVRCYDVSPDGQRFFTTRTLPAPPVTPVTHINLILNWFEELKAKVPAGGAK
jgi:serine/threonine-protein kinase